MLIIGCDFHSRYQQITMAGDRAKDLNQPSVLPWFSASPARVGACGEFFFPRLSTFNFRLSTVQPTPAAVQPSILTIPCKTLNKLISACYSCPVFVATRPRRSLDSFSGLTPTPCPLSPNSFPCHTSENSPVSPIIATLPKMRVSNPCVCHTYDTPRGASQKLLTRNPWKHFPPVEQSQPSPGCFSLPVTSHQPRVALFLCFNFQSETPTRSGGKIPTRSEISTVPATPPLPRAHRNARLVSSPST